jgi:hypothetical protein
MSIGHYLPAGALAHRVATKRGLPFVVVQHGLLTPWAPPPPPGCRFLAWSDADAAFAAREWPEVRAETVGSQLLWLAGRSADRRAEAGGTPIFLGQLHGLELDRSVTIRTVNALAAEGSLVYRPHPAERDILSRLQHRRWERRGVAIERDGPPLRETNAPVIAIFSTGLLEAAAAGLPAWAACSRPPAWVEEIWSRHRISRWGSDEPTPAPDTAGREPAVLVAERVRDLV